MGPHNRVRLFRGICVGTGSGPSSLPGAAPFGVPITGWSALARASGGAYLLRCSACWPLVGLQALGLTLPSSSPCPGGHPRREAQAQCARHPACPLTASSATRLCARSGGVTHPRKNPLSRSWPGHWSCVKPGLGVELRLRHPPSECALQAWPWVRGGTGGVSQRSGQWEQVCDSPCLSVCPPGTD